MTKTAYAYSVTIGMNVPDNNNEPMPDTDWIVFQDYINAILTSTAEVYGGHKSAYFTEKHYGIGEWEGIQEESCKITLITDTRLNRDAVDYIKDSLKKAANLWNQEAIAFSVGTSELIER